MELYIAIMYIISRELKYSNRHIFILKCLKFQLITIYCRSDQKLSKCVSFGLTDPMPGDIH